MRQEKAQLFENYTQEQGPNSVLSNERKTIVQELILQSLFLSEKEAERRQLVQEATGIGNLTFSLAMISLVNEGYLEKGTLKFEYKEQNSIITSSEV